MTGCLILYQLIHFTMFSFYYYGSLSAAWKLLLWVLKVTNTKCPSWKCFIFGMLDLNAVALYLIHVPRILLQPIWQNKHWYNFAKQEYVETLFIVRLVRMRKTPCFGLKYLFFSYLVKKSPGLNVRTSVEVVSNRVLSLGRLAWQPSRLGCMPPPSPDHPSLLVKTSAHTHVIWIYSMYTVC